MIELFQVFIRINGRLLFHTFNFLFFLMTQLSLVKKYHDDGLSAVQIFDILKEIFEDDAIPYSTITYHIRRESWVDFIESDKNKGGRPPNYRIDNLILKELNDDPTKSCRQIAHCIGYSVSSVHYVLSVRLGYKPYNFRWIPHVLNFSQKMARVNDSKALIEILKKAKRNGWHFILTGDESWFFYRTPGGIMWLPEGEQPPSKARIAQGEPKIMVTIFWNPDGLQLIDACDSNDTFNSQYFIEHVLEPIANSDIVAKSKRQKQRFIIHMDNCPVHKSKMTQSYISSHGLYMPRHPPYSPDISPCDFFLFGYLKSKIIGKTFATKEDLISWIEEQISEIPKSVLEKVFTEWLIRLEEVIKVKGEYIE